MRFSLSGLQLLQFAIAVLLPVLVGLVTKATWSPGAKSTLLLLLSTASGLLTEIATAAQANVTYDLGQGLLAAAGTFIVGVAVYYGFWKPTGVAAVAQRSLVK
jgi:hypothetical protein